MTAVAEPAAPESTATVLRRFAVPVYLPATIYAVGQGAVTPVIAIGAHDLGASYATAAFVAGLPAVGVLLGDGPAGAFVARVGERRGMIFSALVTALCSVVVVLAGDLTVLSLAALVMGAASSVFLLARHSLLTELVEPAFRARSLALLAGTYRAGVTIGPFTTAALISHFGALAAFWVQAATSVAVIAFLLSMPDLEKVIALRTDTPGDSMTGLTGMFRENAGPLLRVGSAMAILMLLRNTMVIIIPLWGLAIGMPASRIALAVGLSGLLQLVLVYASGQIADRFGRMWVAMPVVLGIALGHILLVGAHGTGTYFAVVVVLAVANGFGGGIMMMMGSDLAPPGRASEFLGLWRLVNDAGGAAAPFLMAAGTAVVSLGFASVGLGLLGLVGAGMLWRWVPLYLDESRAPAVVLPRVTGDGTAGVNATSP
ncbi:MAG: MFS transporter [Nocardioides sp.]|uniref:MFS transporter n=1 Tax=Nocardioides sp. TaxID=35761 RepID=UPI0039E3B4B2